MGEKNSEFFFADCKIHIHQQEDVASRRVSVGIGIDRHSMGSRDVILQVP